MVSQSSLDMCTRHGSLSWCYGFLHCCAVCIYMAVYCSSPCVLLTWSGSWAFSNGFSFSSFRYGEQLALSWVSTWISCLRIGRTDHFPDRSVEPNALLIIFPPTAIEIYRRGAFGQWMPEEIEMTIWYFIQYFCYFCGDWPKQERVTMDIFFFFFFFLGCDFWTRSKTQYTHETKKDFFFSLSSCYNVALKNKITKTPKNQTAVVDQYSLFIYFFEGIF